ncbi:phosphotransferase [Nocardia sp. NPDC005978]|uniref:phosphotransferase family protein n=1 Tax=Nocardia sp. NPDC005978 TaxID=3156725 RepID=UPI0033A6C3EA
MTETAHEQPAGLMTDFAWRRLMTICAAHVGTECSVARIAGGNVSHVFRVTGGNSTAILKIRGSRFSGIPDQVTDPALIACEVRALSIYHGAAPNIFPEVLEFRPELNAMIMTDIFCDRMNYQDHLLQRPALPGELSRLGAALRTVHDATADAGARVRPDLTDDQRFRDFSLEYVLERHGHPALLATSAALKRQPRQQLILGDLAPKNLSLAGGRVAMCDLDNVHLGYPMFDVGYLLAHIMLHHIDRPVDQRLLTTAFLDAYFGGSGISDDDYAIVGHVAAGTALYRLSGTVPYPAVVAPEFELRVRSEVLRLLSGDHRVLDGLSAALGGAR